MRLALAARRRTAARWEAKTFIDFGRYADASEIQITNTIPRFGMKQPCLGKASPEGVVV